MEDNSKALEGSQWKAKTTSGDWSKHSVFVYEKDGMKCVWYIVNVLTETPEKYNGYTSIRKFGPKTYIQAETLFRFESLELLYQSANALFLEKKINVF